MSERPAGPELTVLYRIPSGSNAVYRCEDCNDRWDLIVPEDADDQ